MQKTLRVSAFLLILTLAGASGGRANAGLLTFDDIASGITQVGVVANGYGGLDWNNLNFMRDDFTATYNGFTNGVVSPRFVAFNGSGNPATILASPGAAIDFTSVYLTGGWNDGLLVTVEGYQGLSMAYTQTVTVSTSGPTLFNFNYLGVTSLRFSSTGGTPHSVAGGTGSQFAMDNLSFALSVPPPPSAVPEPSSAILGLIGGAATLALGRRRALGMSRA